MVLQQFDRGTTDGSYGKMQDDFLTAVKSDRIYSLTRYDSSPDYISNSPFGNVKIYDLDAEIPPIERVQIVPNVPNLPDMSNYSPALPKITPSIIPSQDLAIPNNTIVPTSTSPTTSTIAPISTLKKPNYLVYGLGAILLGLVGYKVLKKN
jgi:hypothetical protein